MPNRHKFLTFCLLFVFVNTANAADTREISSKPKEIYGNPDAPIKLRIGNGGAGPTGILRVLAEDFLKMRNKNYAIAWYQDITVNTLAQLKKGRIDVALAYEKNQIEEAVREGWATNHTRIFNDHFLIVGPKNNQAKILPDDTVEKAFSKIARLGDKNLVQTFLSRNDNSGTNVKEREIWQSLNLTPWIDNSAWYDKKSIFPLEALFYADQNSLYTLTDWGTWLSIQKDLHNLKIYVRGGKTLLNPCSALLGANPDIEAFAFVTYLASERGQKIIADFGKSTNNGQALFTRAQKEEF